MKISFALFLFAFISILSAQTVRGTVEGTLTGPAGATIPAVTVTVTREETGGLGLPCSPGGIGAMRVPRPAAGIMTTTFIRAVSIRARRAGVQMCSVACVSALR